MPNFLKSLKQLAEKYDILLIANEIQSGMERTGRMFASEHFDVIPDIITIAKGIASGLSLGITVANAKIMNWESGSHANTFGGNSISCEVALVTQVSHPYMRSKHYQVYASSNNYKRRG